MTTIVTSNPAKYIALAKTLPRKLQRFLARYPSPQIVKPGATPTHYQTATENPFLVSTNQYTGKLQKPVYSLRRQADLVKAARKYGIEELLPYSTKKTEVRLAHKVKYGSRVKGTGVGQSVKGRLHERRLGVKMDKRRAAMLKMPALIREWKAVGKRNWTKWPKTAT